MSIDGQYARKVSGVCGGSREAVGVRRRRRAIQYAVADYCGREGEGSDGEALPLKLLKNIY